MSLTHFSCDTMSTVIIPFTMVPIHTCIPRTLPYITIQTQSAQDHVRTHIPTYLQGTEGVIQLITTFIGSTYKWVRVLGDIDLVYANRRESLYVLFWVCSHRLPIPASLDALRSHWYRTGTVRRLSCIDKGSQMLPVGRYGLYYTRTGHLGTCEELSHLIRTVSCRGYMTVAEPVLSVHGIHVIVTNRLEYWADRIASNIHVIRVDDVHTLNPDIHWDSVILDHIRPSTPSVFYRYPDDRHLSGSVSTDWIQVDNALRMRRLTIVYEEPISSTVNLLESMFIIQTMYRGEIFIGREFTQEYASVVRLTETLLLEGIIV
jgi:hypothetical protein